MTTETKPEASIVDGEASGRDEAQARAERIRAGIESLAAFQDDLAAAYRRRDWIALGHRSWEDYVSGEFGEHRLALSRAQRQDLVDSLRAESLSTRAISVALGVPKSTVQDDVAAGARNRAGADANASVVGTDGKEYPSRFPPITASELAELKPKPARPPKDLAEQDKTQPAPRPPSPPDARQVPSASDTSKPGLSDSPAAPVRRRRPIADQAKDAGWDIRKAAERVGRVLGDDRFDGNAEQVALALRGHVMFAQEQLAAALQRFGAH